jgi:hypothetical protein
MHQPLAFFDTECRGLPSRVKALARWAHVNRGTPFPQVSGGERL